MHTRRYKIITLLDITSPLLHQEEKLPKVLKAVVKSEEGLFIKYIETEGIQIGSGSIFTCKETEIIKLSEVSFETQTIYLKDEKLIEELLREKTNCKT